MKVIIVFLFTLTGMTLVNFGMDLLMGIDRKIAIFNMLNPFWVMTPFGYLLITGLLIGFFLRKIITFIIKKRKA